MYMNFLLISILILIHFSSTSDLLNSPPFSFSLSQSVVSQSTGPDSVLRAPIPQVVEVTGSESPATFSWNSRNHRVRHDISRARLRAIESSLENGKIWVPPSPAHRKTWEEEVNVLLFIFYVCILHKLVAHTNGNFCQFLLVFLWLLRPCMSLCLQAHIERALHDHFLFRKLTDSQCHVLLDCMQRVEVQPGEVVVKQVTSLPTFLYSFDCVIY